MYTYCVYPAMSKSQRQVPSCLKRAETSIVFNGVLYHTCTYTVTVSYHHSTWNRYQKRYIFVSDCI